MSMMIRYLASLVVIGGAAFLGQQLNDPGTVNVAWQGNLAVLEWKEDLADPKAAAEEVPFSILTGPYLSWLTPEAATIGWEVVGAKSLTNKPYASLPGDFPASAIKFRSATLT